MSHGRQSRDQPGDRAQSHVIGVILVVGMVVTSATLITMSGAAVLDDYRRLAGAESTTNTIEEVDTKLSSVASVRGVTRSEINIGDAQPSQFDVTHSGYIDIAVNGNSSCTERIGLGSLRFEEGDGDVVAYEAGGIWRQPKNGNETIMHTPPDLTFDGGTLSLTVINVTGEIEEENFLVRENVTKSKVKNNETEATLFNTTCERPDNVTLTIKSDFYHGWSRYLDGEINATNQTTYHSNDTVEVFFDQGALPEETNDEINNVVDLDGSTINDVDMTNESIMVNKSANNTYTVVMTPLASGSTQVGEIREVEGGVAYRAPMDVVFVLDASGSMDYEADGDDMDDNCNEPNTNCISKMDEAKAAATGFVGLMNSSFDRSGAVAFNDSSFYMSSSGEAVYLSNEFDRVNESINNTHPDSGTHSAKGLRKAIASHGLKSNSSRKRIIILLSDGRDDAGADDPVTVAQQADKQGITIHTIGFGNASNATLKNVSDATGGTFHYAASADELDEVFDDIFAQVAESKQIVRDPLVVNMSASGTSYQAQIDGDASHIANTSSGSPNVNDPTAPSEFAFSIDVEDGENVSVTGLHYGCDEWERTDIVHTNQTTGKTYNEVRCTDINESNVTEVPPRNMSVYLDGDNVSSLLDQPQNWWDEDLRNDTLAPYLEADNETLDLESNEAIFVFEFSDGDDGTDMLLTKYEIGQSKEETVPKYVFNVVVRYLEIR